MIPFLLVCSIILVVCLYLAGRYGKAQPSGVVPDADPIRSIPVLASLQDVELFLLNVFRSQLAAARDAPAKIVPVAKQYPGSMRVYDLQVKHQGKWKSRRVAIAALGEGTGSKSQCFYVVYDSHMVIKIPAAPIKDFKEYARRIKQEAAVVKQLAPLECIIPNVSMILQKMRILPDSDGLALATPEEEYVRWLEAYPRLQSHLKIGDVFAFFMDLSKYRFLGQIMGRLHDMEDDICRTVYADADIVWDYHEFVNKYDKKHDTVCFELQQVYAQFDNGIKHLLTVIEYTDSLYEKDKMKWLLSHLAGRGVVEMPKDLPEQLVSQIKMLLRKIAAEHSDVAEAYKNLVIEHVKNRVFVRKKFQIEGIIVNLLSLLDWLRQRKIAMRDIKPDNLLIAGDLDDQPLLLASPDEYSIGLIDLETAVILANEANETRQPMLGGTPLYATPSHFFTNELLQDVYKDVATVLMLQDWFAAVGIIYELVTGEKLFFKTANKLHGIVRKLRSTDDRERCVPQLYWNINRYFWRFAKMEFAHNLEQTKAVLDAAQVKVPDSVKGWLEQFLIPTGAGDHGQSKAVALPQNGSSKSPVYALLTVMFEVVMNNMVAAAPDKIEAGVAKADADMREASPADAAAEPQVLGFTFTV